LLRTNLAANTIVTPLRAATLACVIAASIVPGCAPGARLEAPATTPALELTLLDTVILPAVTTPPGGRREGWFGSLSGLARDARSGRYLAVIDDRDPSRVAWLEITVREGRLAVVPGEVVPIHPGAGIDAETVSGADLEAIVALPDGTWMASEEGHRLTGVRGPRGEVVPARSGSGRLDWPPMLLALDATFSVTRLFPWPERFALGPNGVRENQGFEGLALTPDGRLIAGLEQPLLSDMPAVRRNGRLFGGGRGGPSRLVELVAEGGGWRTRREWVYELDATTARAGERTCDDGESGLTELLAIDNSRLFALERGCLSGPHGVRNTARLYLADTRDAGDVSPIGGASVASARPVAKILLVDFDTLIRDWPPELANLDNFEALAFGPRLPDGPRTLIVMSDDNFRPTQHTVFAWFQIEEPGSSNQEAGTRNQEP
jgi:hypothetical protein